MDTTDLIANVRAAVAQVAGTPEGLDAIVPLTARQATSLVNIILEQERELMESDRTMESRKEKVTAILDSLSCIKFEKEFPNESYDGMVFEVFVGESITDCGRLFVHWSASKGEFFYPGTETEERNYVENVMFWRYPLPEPHEAFDVGDL